MKMKMKMKILIWLLTLSVNFLNVNSNDCTWLNNGLDCVIQCSESYDLKLPDTISGYVQSVYDSNFTDCHSTGVKLILPQRAFYSNLRPDWLKANINLIELEMDASKISEFEANAFQSSVFATVKRLNLKNVRLNIGFYYKDITKDIFVGLEALEDLMITGSALKVSDNGWLDNINGTIRSLLLTGMGGEPSFIIQKLTGSNARMLSNVEYVKIKYNLLNSIDDHSFTAIPNVKELDLSNSNILFIAERSFENFGSKLRLLNLERNRLTKLPVGIFSSLDLSSSVTLSPNLQSDEESDETSLTIWLGDNRWDCNCSVELEHLQELLKTNTNFAGEILCTTPDKMVDYPIRDTVLCPAFIATTATTESTTIPIEKDNDVYEKQCLPYNGVGSKTNISIEPEMQRILLNRTSEDVTVMLDKHSEDLILIWFKSEKLSNDATGYYQNSNTSDCFANLSYTIHINDLEQDISYTFCLMNITQQSVSPLDCIPYYNQRTEETLQAAWLYDSIKPLTISLVVIASIANIMIGVIIGAIFMKFTKYETFSFRLAIQCWKDSQRDSHDFKNSLHLSVNPNDDNIPPPLPPHPLRDLDDDEVYYTTVK